MTENSFEHKTLLEVDFADRPQQTIPLVHFPFLIGRPGEADNHLKLDDEHVSHRCAAIVAARGGYRLED